jgi:hypothetical protein
MVIDTTNHILYAAISTSHSSTWRTTGMIKCDISSGSITRGNCGNFMRGENHYTSTTNPNGCGTGCPTTTYALKGDSEV